MAYKARERTVGCTKQRIAQAGTGLEVNGQVQEVVPGAEKKKQRMDAWMQLSETKTSILWGLSWVQDADSMGVDVLWSDTVAFAFSHSSKQINQFPGWKKVKKWQIFRADSSIFIEHTHFSWLNPYLVGGFSPCPSEKWWNEFVSWDYSLNIMGKSFKIPWFQYVPVTTNQIFSCFLNQSRFKKFPFLSPLWPVGQFCRWGTFPQSLQCPTWPSSAPWDPAW